MLEYRVSARRIDAHGSEARAKEAVLVLDTDLAGRADALNPAELLLAALAACILKGVERVMPILNFQLSAVSVRLHGVRQDSPPRLQRITYELLVDTAESDHRLDLLLRNVQKFGTIHNTLAPAVELVGTVRRA
ncbi:Uncharacterized OsmC-related protein [Gemmobacter aquatilis]|uniref:Uncharacterized OsmC-related protein n=1 Tax=Gemmobacter aquatilis TaxID=933059 RepID=A0A1H8KMS5_9RHOB|nr:OsmC family protein [Gemmobacter aquatilis]SEN94195.1 Uncharacterized OsmC-related protein [Gemmobacter aquatilis]